MTIRLVYIRLIVMYTRPIYTEQHLIYTNSSYRSIYEHMSYIYERCSYIHEHKDSYIHVYKGSTPRYINNSRPSRAPEPEPERLHLVRSRKRSHTSMKEWKYVLVCHMTPPSRRICPLGPYISNLIFWIMCYIYVPVVPVGPVGPPVARSAANPWAPGFENLTRTTGVVRPELSPQPRGFGRNLFPAKALASARAAKPNRADAEPGLLVDWCMGLENLKRTSPARIGTPVQRWPLTNTCFGARLSLL